MKALLTLVTLILLTGCATHEVSPRVEYVERVKTIEVVKPIKCTIQKCERPQLLDYKNPNMTYVKRAGNLLYNMEAYEAYTQCLERSVEICTKDIERIVNEVQHR